MWRVLIFLALICLAAWGAVSVADLPETLSFTWAGERYTTSLAIGVAFLSALVLLVGFSVAAFYGVLRLPLALARRAHGRRQRKGYEALSRGIVAVGAGDVAAARRYAGDAERLLGNQPLALLLKAQAAQASGDRDKAEATFREMAEGRETKVLGLRGLYLEARRRGEGAVAREYAEEAARIAPAVSWASDAVLEARSAEGDWAGAIRAIERRTSLGLVDRTTSRRQRAVLLTAEAQEKEARDPEGALKTAEHAVKLAPDLVPAATLAGQLLSRRGDLKKAARIIETAWEANPHPDLAGAYLNLRPGDSAIDRLKRAETLARLSEWSEEARFAIARTAIDARDFARAREALKPLVESETRPTVRLCVAMAEIEGRSGQAGPAREWLARAARAPRDKAWIADGYVSERWLPVSPVSGRLDAFVWDTPPELLGDATGPNAAAFEPDQDDEVPAFLGRAIPPPAAAPADPAPVPAEKAAAPVIEAEPKPVEAPSAAAAPTQPDKNAPAKDAPAKDAPAKHAAAKDASAAAKPEAAAPSARREAANGAAERGRPTAEPEPVVFPVRHAPDDPGLEGEGDRRQRFRLHV